MAGSREAEPEQNSHRSPQNSSLQERTQRGYEKLSEATPLLSAFTGRQQHRCKELRDGSEVTAETTSIWNNRDH